MAVIEHPNPPDNGHGGVWKDAEGNIDWDAYADQAEQQRADELADRGSCATCDGGGCGDCR